MTNKHCPARNVVKAALAYAKGTTKILVRFNKPAGANENKLRHVKPTVLPELNSVVVRAFSGLWSVKATVVPHGNLRNAKGRLYKATISFDAQHLAWLDEIGVVTPAKLRRLVAGAN